MRRMCRWISYIKYIECKRYEYSVSVCISLGGKSIGGEKESKRGSEGVSSKSLAKWGDMDLHLGFIGLWQSSLDCRVHPGQTSIDQALIDNGI